MADLQTWNPLNVNEVYTPGSLTTAENAIVIRCTPLNIGSQTTGRAEPIIQLRSDIAWFYRYVAGGASFPVAAGELFNFRIVDARNLTRIYVIGQTTTGTIYGMRIV